MVEAGLLSQFPMEDVSAVGIWAVVTKLPTILRRLREVVTAIEAARPDIVILIDAPDFTHRIAGRVRRFFPTLPIVKYVSPTVWFWRPGRAKRMRPTFDLVLALFPFEPEVLRQLGGPPCVYVGHPLLERMEELRPSLSERAARDEKPPLILALPGSRGREVRALGKVFGEALGIVSEMHGPLEVVIPTLPHLVEQVRRLVRAWPVTARIVTTEEEKTAAFRRARAALAASGTATLELGLAGVPHIAAYRIPLLEGLAVRMATRLHPVIRARSVVLANLLLGETIVPEFLQTRCTADNLATALVAIVDDGVARQRQVEAFRRFDAVLDIGGGTPSDRAASAVLALLQRGRSPLHAGQAGRAAI
jgi:lipid-A-disaccharide synthase